MTEFLFCGMTEFLFDVSPRRIRMTAQRLKLTLENGTSVSALLLRPDDARACFVFAHGAGAGMSHPFMEKVATGLCDRGIATLRYQFPYMEKGSRRPDPPAVAHAAVRAAVKEAARCCDGLPLIAGGKSFGGRMTSQAQSLAPLPGVRGLAFLGFPLHPPGKPSTSRAAHLSELKIPVLFLQGTRDDFAEMSLLEPVVKGLGGLASLHVVLEGDHSLHVPARSGRKNREVMNDVLDALSAWIGGLA
jgi:predicted alpha/beta-hydrolase family hydrolase